MLSRILEVRAGGEALLCLAKPSDDHAWHASVTLQIRPHPDLSPAQQTAIRLDYGMDETGLAEVTVRQSMLYYTLKRLGLDTDPAARRPQDQQIILANAAEVMPKLGHARA